MIWPLYISSHIFHIKKVFVNPQNCVIFSPCSISRDPVLRQVKDIEILPGIEKKCFNLKMISFQTFLLCLEALEQEDLGRLTALNLRCRILLKKNLLWIGRNNFKMTYLQDTTLQVEEDETPAKEDVKFNPGTSWGSVFLSWGLFMLLCDGNSVDPFLLPWTLISHQKLREKQQHISPTR